MTKSKNNLTAIAIIALIALLGLNGYQWFTNNQLKTQNIRQENEMIELEKVQAELDQSFQDALESLEEMRTDNRELNTIIEGQKKELLAQKDKISGLIWTKRELAKAKEEILALNNQAAQYVAEISSLKEQNQLLASNNVQLQQQNQSLSLSFEQERKAKQEIEQARAVLAAEKEKLDKSNEELSVKVDMANAIKINYMEFQGYKVKKNGKRKKKSKAKDIMELDVCFVTETNMVTPGGVKEFQLRLIDPMGETVAIEAQGSGVLTNKLDNTQVRYTTSGSLEYNNEDTRGCITWKAYDRMVKGNYEAELYNNGFLVGKGSFRLK